MNLNVAKYSEVYESKWDNFVLNNSVNGTFLQTRRFLNYHPESRFVDNSLIIVKGTNSIVAVIPACLEKEENKKIFNSHKGSTFGGIIISNEFNDVEHVSCVIEALENYLHNEDFSKVILKNTSEIFSNNNTHLLDYFLFKENYSCWQELSFYIDFSKYGDTILSNFNSNRRRDFKNSLSYDLEFRKIEDRKNISLFHNLLKENLKKFNKTPIHTVDELIEFKESRLRDIVDFYGIYYDGNQLVAASMIFKFANRCLHAQYFACDYNVLQMNAMTYLNYELIKLARESKFKYFSFGISTEDYGKYLNTGLARFKEGFGATYSVNKTYYKTM